MENILPSSATHKEGFFRASKRNVASKRHFSVMTTNELFSFFLFPKLFALFTPHFIRRLFPRAAEIPRRRRFGVWIIRFGVIPKGPKACYLCFLSAPLSFHSRASIKCRLLSVTSKERRSRPVPFRINKPTAIG